MMSRQPLRGNPWDQVPNPARLRSGKDEMLGLMPAHRHQVSLSLLKRNNERSYVQKILVQ